MQKQIVKLRHSNASISVFYWSLPNKDAGLDVMVEYDASAKKKPVVARFYNPADVTAWFEDNSAANLGLWRDAFHKAGLKNSDFRESSVEAVTTYLVKSETELWQVAKNALGDPARWPEIWVLNPQLQERELRAGMEVKIPQKAELSPAASTVGAKGDVLLKVPFLSQRDNAYQPGGSCNVTSCAMVMLYNAVKPKHPSRYPQFEDELNRYIVAEGKDRHNHGDLSWMMRQYGLKASFDIDRTHEQIRAELRAGRPVITSGKFTRAGHIIVLIGLAGKDYICHDPWGNALKGYRRDSSGKQVLYPFGYMNDTMRQQGENAKWAHFVRRSD